MICLILPDTAQIAISLQSQVTTPSATEYALSVMLQVVSLTLPLVSAFHAKMDTNTSTINV